MKTKAITRAAIASLLAAALVIPQIMGSASAADASSRIVVLSDVHYGSKELRPGPRKEIMARKEKAMDEVASWKDADMCVFTGDMVEMAASVEEYRLARSLTDRIKQHKAFVAGNHELVYSEKPLVDGVAQPADPIERVQHLERYIENYGPLYHSEELGGYLLVFLSPDELTGHLPKGSAKPYAVELSDAEVTWLSSTLKANQDKPTIIFCHTPLAGSIEKGSKEDLEKNFTQPVEKLHDILARNPQVMLWVSGHTHTSPRSASYSSAVNRQSGAAVVDIHNPAWEGDEIWTNSIFLYKDKVEVRTWSHKDHRWLDPLDRSYAVLATGERKALMSLASIRPRRADGTAPSQDGGSLIAQNLAQGAAQPLSRAGGR